MGSPGAAGVEPASGRRQGAPPWLGRCRGCPPRAVAPQPPTAGRSLVRVPRPGRARRLPGCDGGAVRRCRRSSRTRPARAGHLHGRASVPPRAGRAASSPRPGHAAARTCPHADGRAGGRARRAVAACLALPVRTRAPAYDEKPRKSLDRDLRSYVGDAWGSDAVSNLANVDRGGPYPRLGFVHVAARRPPRPHGGGLLALLPGRRGARSWQRVPWPPEGRLDRHRRWNLRCRRRSMAGFP